MAEDIRVGLPDGSEREFPAGTTVLEVAEAIGPRLARDTIAGMVNGDLVDLRTRITSDVDLRIVTAKDPEGGDVIRHSAEHVLADAVKRLWPGTPIDAGRQDHSEKYQYDFRFPRAFKPEDFEKIEARMREIIDADAEVVVLSRGMWKRLRVCPETLEMLETRSIAAHVLPTKEAARLYNQLRETEPVGALIHSTC